MKNQIDASIEFYYKGERYSPTVTIDLDQFMATHQENHDHLTPIYSLLASKNNIDTYSYQYEIMLAGTIQFSNATGIATDYLCDGVFDIAGIETALHEQIIIKQLQPIAKQYLSIDDLAQHPDLKAALMAAYMLKKNKNNISSNEV